MKLFPLIALSIGALACSHVASAGSPAGSAGSVSNLAFNVPQPMICESLADLKLPDTKITKVESITSGTFTPTGQPAITGLPTFCRVVGVIFPQINFEVWLPAFTWNGKFLMVGNGGTAGFINYSQNVPLDSNLPGGIKRGYATASTDTGHTAADVNFTWMNSPGLFHDWAVRGTNETTIKAKIITEKFYGPAPRLSYFSGCSGGGQQAMTAVQRTNNFDGVVAGAGAFNWGPLMAGELNGNYALRAGDPTGPVPLAKLALLNTAVLEACDALDGAKDGVLQEPRLCKFDAATLQCSGADSANCLTAAQVAAVKRVYRGASNPRTSEEIYPGLSPGSELEWAPLVTGAVPFGSTYAYHRFGVFQNANWDYRTFDYDKDYELARTKLGTVDSSFNPDLRDFRDRGAKLIMYHGWNDFFLSPYNTVNYYENVVNVQKADDGPTSGDGYAATQTYARLFMLPGVSHCSGGAGADNFDPIAALENWVERGIAPERLVSTKVVGNAVTRTRPLCAHPRVAYYKGSGDVNDAANFECRTEPFPK